MRGRARVPNPAVKAKAWNWDGSQTMSGWEIREPRSRRAVRVWELFCTHYPGAHGNHVLLSGTEHDKAGHATTDFT